METDDGEIDGLNAIEQENTPIDDLETEDVNLMLIGIDASASMSPYVDTMKDELNKFKQSIINSKEAEKILVSRADFSSDLKFRGYKKIAEFDVDYRTYDSTRLYDLIVEGAKKLKDYIAYLRKLGMRVKAVFAVFTDGEDTASVNNAHKAVKVIEEMNRDEIVTALVAFGNNAKDEARDLGVKNTLEVGKSESELRKAFNQLSKSIISQSKSVLPKKDDFFEA